MRRRTKTVLEGDIEKRFVRELKKLGCKSRKLNGTGYRDWPDRLIMVPGGITLFIEFKRPGEELRPSQQELHDEAAEMGHDWQVFDSWENAIEYVRQHMRV
jgi:hypothetical protein